MKASSSSSSSLSSNKNQLFPHKAVVYLVIFDSSSEDVELGVEQVAHRKVVVAQSTVHADLAPPAKPFRFLMCA
jgi:D-Tyr-tRNAtyr deacylase